MAKKQKHDYSTILIWAALLVTVIRYAGAFLASDMGIITGWLSDVMHYGDDSYRTWHGLLGRARAGLYFRGLENEATGNWEKWNNRFLVLTGFVMGMFLTGLTILVPFTVSRVLQEPMGSVLGRSYVWVWAMAVNLAPYLIVGGVVTSTPGFVTVSATDATSTATSIPSIPVSTATDAVASATVTCKQCGEVFASRPHLMAHTRYEHPKEVEISGNGHHM